MGVSGNEVIQLVGKEDIDFGTGTNADSKTRVNALHIKFSSDPSKVVDQLVSGTAIELQSATPTTDSSVANKGYVDSAIKTGTGTDKGKGATNLSVIRPTVTSISLTADTVVVTGVSGQKVIPVTTALTAFISTIGQGGLDAGTKTVSTWYYIWVINDSSGTNPNALLLSVSPTDPTVPSGYTHKAMVSAVYNDSSNNFSDFFHIDDEYYYPSRISIGTSGTLEAKTALPYALVKSAHISGQNSGSTQWNGNFGNDGTGYPIRTDMVQNSGSISFNILVTDKSSSSVKLYSSGSGGTVVFYIYGFSTIR